MQKEEELGFFKELFSSFNSQQLLKQLLLQLHSDQDFQLNQLIDIFNQVKQEYTIPLSIFSHDLHPTEALCKFLKEEKNLSYPEIAKLLNRNQKSVWATYQRASKKMRKQFSYKSLKNEHYHLPLSIFNDRSYSLLEKSISYLSKTYQLSNREIANLLNKSPNSIAVLAKRAREKK